MPTFDFVLLSVLFEIDGKEKVEEFPVDSSTNGKVHDNKTVFFFSCLSCSAFVWLFVTTLVRLSNNNSIELNKVLL
jgi:hypothetical protein